MTLRRQPCRVVGPQNAVGVIGQAAAGVVGAPPDVLAAQRRIRGPNYDPMAVGSSVAAEAGAKSERVVERTLGPGPYAREGVALPGGNIKSPGVRELVNESGDLNGCHMCGAPKSGFPSGNWVRDEFPWKILAPNSPRTAWPQCRGCMAQQGGTTRAVQAEQFDFGPSQ